MVEVICDRQVVRAHLLDCAIWLGFSRLELLSFKDIVCLCSWLLHLFHLSIHVGNFFVHINNLVHF